MRTLRTVLIFCLGLILGAIAAYSFFLWKRGPQPVMSVYPDVGVLPLLQAGQVLEWQSSDGVTGFSVNWIGDSPCKAAGPLASAPVAKIPTVTCRVKKNLTPGQPFYYYFGPQTPPPVTPLGPGTTPCYGCTSVVMTPPGDTVKPRGGSESSLLRRPVGGGFPGLVGVSCLGPDPGITLIPPTVQAAPDGTGSAEVTWSPATGATLTSTAPAFTNASPSCKQNGSSWTCTFTPGQDYSNVTYTIGANGQTCGATPAKGTVTAPN
jgi:hypothetical protein